MPAVSHAQTLVAKASDGAKWLIYVDTINVGDALQNRDRLVSALVEKPPMNVAARRIVLGNTRPVATRTATALRGGAKTPVPTSGLGMHLVLDILATRICQYAWDRVEPDAGIEFPLKHAVSHRGNTPSANGPARGNVGL